MLSVIYSGRGYPEPTTLLSSLYRAPSHKLPSLQNTISRSDLTLLIAQWAGRTDFDQHSLFELIGLGGDQPDSGSLDLRILSGVDHCQSRKRILPYVRSVTAHRPKYPDQEVSVPKDVRSFKKIFVLEELIAIARGSTSCLTNLRSTEEYMTITNRG